MLLKLICDDNSNNNDIDFTNLSTNNDEISPSKQIKCIFGIVKNNQPKYFFFFEYIHWKIQYSVSNAKQTKIQLT